MASTTAIDRAIKREEKAAQDRKIQKKEEAHTEATYTRQGTIAAGIAVGAAHDRLRGKPSEDDPTKTAVAKYGPIPANLTGGAVLAAGSLLVPKKHAVVRAGIGGIGLGQLYAGLYRVVYDNMPEPEPEES